jgi:predicted transcriptional regulator
MAMLVVDDEDFLAEMARLGLFSIKPPIKPNVPLEVSPLEVPQEEITVEDSPIETVLIEAIQRGRGPAKEIPSPIRQFIAEESLNGASAKELSETMGVSESSISAYKNGATSTATYNKPDDDLMNHVSKVKTAIATAARNKLMTAISSLSDDKIANAKAKDIAGIAKDMASVVKQLEEKTDENKGPQVQFVFFAPKVKPESYFPVIEVSE